MLAYTIAPALESGVFDAVIVSTDSEEIGRDRAPLRRRGSVPAAGGVRRRHVARHRVGRVHARQSCAATGRRWDCFQPAAADQPVPHGRHDPSRLGAVHRRRRASIRCGRSRSARSIPARCGSCRAIGCCRCCSRPDPDGAPPWHSTPYQALPPVYVQNASLEIAWTRVVPRRGRSPATCSCRS